MKCESAENSAYKIVLVRSMQCRLFKKLSGVFAPIIANLCNASFYQFTLPVDQKRIIMRPLIKKPSLDHHATTDQETIAGYE